MAAQCGGLNPSSFVSSSAYYGYVPIAQSAKLEAPASPPAAGDSHMDVDAEPADGQQTGRVDRARKRGFGHDELAAYMPRLKRLREGQGDPDNEENLNTVRATIDKLSGFDFRGGGNKRLFHDAGDCICPEECGLAQMYHESTVLRLSPAADFDMACAPLTAKTGNLKFQSPAQSKSKISPIRSQELEEMLMLTHGCTSYHHYRQSQPYLMNGSVETEF